MQDEALWTRIEAASLVSISELKSRPPKPFRSKPLSDQVATAIVLEAKRFLYLLATTREALTPSLWVVEALNMWLANPDADLSEMKNLILAQSHVPLGLIESYDRTRALRTQVFTAEDPEHIWPSPRTLKLQLAGWAFLVVGVVMGVLARLGGETGPVALGFLALGGFLWFAEGPWPANLPIRRSFVARLNP